MLKLALTGGIGTGKTYVRGQFERRGVPCLDADVLAHGVTAAGTEATAAIAARFGPGVLAADGSVDRGVLGPIVFADAAARRELEALVHPAVYRAIAAGLRGLALTEHPALAVVDIPLLYESGRPEEFDAVVVTTCPPEMQIERLMKRGMSESAARQRVDAQMASAEKARRAKYVIDTSGTFEQTDRQIDDILKSLAPSP
jgi:dephospho-CoA kinase